MRLCLALFILVPVAFSSTARAEPATITVHPTEDTLAVLHNPDMGWVLYENYPLDQDPGGSSTMLGVPDDGFPAVDAVALMFSWQDIELEPDGYDFSHVHKAYDTWSKRGKQIQLRLSSESLVWWTNHKPPAGKGIPDYVLEQIPDSEKEERQCEGIPYVVVDARNAYYRERLAKFLAAVANEFSDQRPITLIDLRGFGLWGEWHTGYRYKSLEDRHAALSGILDIWASAFPKHYLLLSYSYDPDSPPELRSGPTLYIDPAQWTHYQEFLHYSAFDHALTKPNIAFRRDGAGGAVHSGERRLCDEAFATLAKGPMMCEFLGGYADAKKVGPARAEVLLNDALSLHPNYLNVLGWQGADAQNFIRERPELVAHGLRTMGYRLVPIEVRYPAQIAVGDRISVEMEWVNRGVGRAMQDFQMQLRLVDQSGKQVGVGTAGKLPTHTWIRDRSYPLKASARIQNVPTGDYRLEFGLFEGSGKSIALPLVATSPNGFYKLGPIRVAPAK